MAFNLTKAQEKRLALLQRVSFEKLFPELDFSFDLILFPESSILLGEIKRITDSKDGTESREVVQSFGRLVDFAERQNGRCILLLPGLSPQVGFIYAKYPPIKIESERLPSLLNLIRVEFDKFDYLALVAENLEHGVVLDVYAGNPEVQGSDEEICKTTVW